MIKFNTKIEKLIHYANSTNIDNVVDLYLFDLITFNELKQVSEKMNSDLDLEDVKRCHDEMYLEV